MCLCSRGTTYVQFGPRPMALGSSLGAQLTSKHRLTWLGRLCTAQGCLLSIFLYLVWVHVFIMTIFQEPQEQRQMKVGRVAPPLQGDSKLAIS